MKNFFIKIISFFRYILRRELQPVVIPCDHCIYNNTKYCNSNNCKALISAEMQILNKIYEVRG